jgi:hypothetical protein
MHFEILDFLKLLSLLGKKTEMSEKHAIFAKFNNTEKYPTSTKVSVTPK